MRWLIWSCCLLLSTPATADILVPTRTIRAREIISAEDLIYKSVEVPGAVTDLSVLVGQEAQISLYPGRPVRSGDVGPPAIVDRNDIVALVFAQGGLRISTEGRVLGRGAAGDSVRVMNLTSRTTVMGWVMPDGSIEVR